MATNDHDVTIYMEQEYVSLQVVLPRRHVGDFIVQFGEHFATFSHASGEKTIKVVDDYYSHPSGWHIKVSVNTRQKDELYSFIRNFCQKKKLSFRDPQGS